MKTNLFLVCFINKQGWGSGFQCSILTLCMCGILPLLDCKYKRVERFVDQFQHQYHFSIIFTSYQRKIFTQWRAQRFTRGCKALRGCKKGKVDLSKLRLQRDLATPLKPSSARHCFKVSKDKILAHFPIPVPQDTIELKSGVMLEAIKIDSK